jgi:twitching motility protein PilT
MTGARRGDTRGYGFEGVLDVEAWLVSLGGVNIAPIERYLEIMWEKGGSDLLITALSPPLMRIDGQLIPIEGEPSLEEDHVDDVVLSVLTDDLKQELRADREVDFSFSYKNVARFRGNCFFQMGALAMSLRMIPMKLPTFEELGLPPAVEYFANLPQGLVLVTGPTGSGKSTSLAAIIDYININRHCHIVTIEDPVEYVHHHKASAITQREVGTDTHSFARALRAALREDPDVILVGEMRDPETVQFALSIAETGHLVFATLHTNDAPQSLDRISDMFSSERQNQIRVQLAACLAGVVSQRLIPRVGGGMIAAFEILIANNAVRALVREGKTHQIRNVLASGRAEGMCTLETWLNHLVQNGLITYEDALARSSHPKEIVPPSGAQPTPFVMAGT